MTKRPEDRRSGKPAAAQNEETIRLSEDTALPQGPASSDQSSEEWIGKSIGRFQILDFLGRGGMGVVYRANDPGLQRDVAIKMLYHDRATDEATLQRFLREARAAAKLRSNHVVSVFEVDQIDELHYIVMEYVEGGSVGDRLKAGALSEDEATAMIEQACQGLAAAHAQGLIHRDIKPGNLLLSEKGVVRVADFGLVKRLNSDSMAVTQEGSMMGSPHYMSPEQFSGDEVDHRTDIYSLGATFFALLTGRHAYQDAENVPQMIYAHLHKPVPDPREVNPQISANVAAVVQRAMAKSPDERYQSAEEMLADLSRPAATPVSAAERLGARRAWLIGAVALAGLVYLALLLRGVRPPGTSAGDETASGNITTTDSTGGANEAMASVPALDTANPIRLGVIYSTGSDLAKQESDLADAVEFACARLNEDAGILGRSVDVIRAEAADWQEIEQQARRLIGDERVSALLGGWTAPARKTLTAVVEELDGLLICPVRFGGLEGSSHVAYLGSIPNQQVIPAVDWAVHDQGKRRFYLVGTEGFEFPHIANLILAEAIKEAGGQLVGETYLPAGNYGIGFAKGSVQSMLSTGTDVIVSTLQGEANIGFYRALRDENLSGADRVITIALSLNERDLREIELDGMRDDYAVSGYFQSWETPTNLTFVQEFRAEHGATRVVTDPMATAYAAVHLWAAAVNAAGAPDPTEVRKRMVTERCEAPFGEIWLDADNRHAFRAPVIGKVDADGQFEIVWQADAPIGPDPYPWDTKEDWERVLDGFRDATWRFRR